MYATISGHVSLPRPGVVSISGGHGVEFSFWHLTTVVAADEYATAYRTIIGRIEAPWAHVHFAEAHNGVYVNPLRPGAMAPFADHRAPVVRAVQAERGGRVGALADVSGSIRLVVDVVHATPLLVRQPWSNLPVMPALVRWRVVGVTGLGNRPRLPSHDSR